MDTKYIQNTDKLLDSLHSLDMADSVQGIGVFAAEQTGPDSSDINPVLRNISTPVFGGIFPEIIHRGKKFDTGTVVFMLKKAPSVSVISGLSDSSSDFSDQLPERVPSGGTAFVFVDAFASQIETLISQLFNTYGVDCNYLGGGAGSLSMDQQPCLFTNQGLVMDSAVFATVDIETKIGVKHGWKKVDGPFQVTKASDRKLEMLDDTPAFELYRQVLNDDAELELDCENFFEVAKMYPFGISRLDGEDIVRDPYEVTDDGCLHCFGNVPEGEFLHVLKGDPDRLISAAKDAYTATGNEASDDLIFFDCISRVLYLEDIFTQELEAVGGNTEPAIGALTIGEIANDSQGHLDYYNKTAVAAVTDEL